MLDHVDIRGARACTTLAPPKINVLVKHAKRIIELVAKLCTLKELPAVM